jgi:ribosomal protein L16 Arg81 hydroxylase
MPLADLVPDADKLFTHWPTEPIVYHHQPGTFDHLLTMGEVDALIDNDCLPNRNVRIIRDGEIVDDREYSDIADMPRKGAVRALINDGASLSVRLLQTLKPALSILRREVATETGYETHFNAYLTPPGQHGLRFHFDPYVTLVIQLHGSKLWPLHRPFVENPVEEYANFRHRGFTEAEREYLQTTEPVREVLLRPGDVFWLPRGWVHSPHNLNGDETSLHLTFALKQRTLYWAAEEITSVILRHILQDPAARAGIQPADLLGRPEATADDVRSVLIGALMALDATEMGNTLRRTAQIEPPSPFVNLR